jgi:hypothetical protein
MAGFPDAEEITHRGTGGMADHHRNKRTLLKRSTEKKRAWGDKKEVIPDYAYYSTRNGKIIVNFWVSTVLSDEAIHTVTKESFFKFCSMTANSISGTGICKGDLDVYLQRELLETRDMTDLIVETERGEVRGVCLFRVDREKKEAYVSIICSNLSGKGTYMMKRIIDRMNQYDEIEKITLNSVSTPQTMAFYERLGFTPVFGRCPTEEDRMAAIVDAVDAISTEKTASIRAIKEVLPTLRNEESKMRIDIELAKIEEGAVGRLRPFAARRFMASIQAVEDAIFAYVEGTCPMILEKAARQKQRLPTFTESFLEERPAGLGFQTRKRRGT